MEQRQVQLLRIDDIIQSSSERPPTTDELLVLGSEIFYSPITTLESCKGEDEYNKRPEVRTAFNLLRALDNLEDSRFKIYDKSRLIDNLASAIGEVVRRDNNEEIGDIVDGDEFKNVIQGLSKGATNERERIFAKYFGYGGVLQELHGFDREVKDAIDYTIKSIALGMKNFLTRGEIQTKEQLAQYCYHVAGRIGYFLNKLVELKDNPPLRLDSSNAEKSGEFLQLINIIQNVREDWEEERVYFPAMLRPNDVSHQYLMIGEGIEAERARRYSLDNMLAITEDNFGHSVDYIMSIPGGLRGFKTFNLMLLLFGEESYKKIQTAEVEKIFAGDEDAIKIPYASLSNIVALSQLITKKDDGRANDWLGEYRKDPHKFSFNNGEFRDWAPRYIV